MTLSIDLGGRQARAVKAQRETRVHQSAGDRRAKARLAAAVQAWLAKGGPDLPPYEERRRLISAPEALGLMQQARRHPNLTATLAYETAARIGSALPQPFDQIEPDFAFGLDRYAGTPQRSAARQRSVAFVHHSYYHFHYLAQALRKRGWDAICISGIDPLAPESRFIHGEDINYFVDGIAEYQRAARQVFERVLRRYKMIHFSGDRRMSFFLDNTPLHESILPPWDFLEARRHGLKIAYTVSGCLDGVEQRAVRKFTHGLCGKCPWESRPDVCSDQRNREWGAMVEEMCDLVCVDTDYPLQWRAGVNCYREPLSTALDSDLWHPDLEIPAHRRVQRGDGETIVFHAFGNFHLRDVAGRNIKGTPAIVDAVNRLRSEGVNVRLEFVTNVPSAEMRFIQSQCDIIVDQLNYGRYGATAREAMMLGKPTVCYIDPRQPRPLKPMQSLAECPLVSASEETLYDVLKDLIASPEKRANIGAASRAYAMKWHSADACAERYERVYDRTMQGRPAEG